MLDIKFVRENPELVKQNIQNKFQTEKLPLVDEVIALDNENRIIAQAKEEAARIMERAHTEAALEKQKLADDVKKEIVTVASFMAGKMVAASIDAKVQDQLISETLKEMGENTWLS